MSIGVRRSWDTTAAARTRGVTATIEGLLASIWFAWARSDASTSMRSWLEIGGVAALLVASAGLVLAASRYGRPAQAGESALRRRYNRIVAAEVMLLMAGAAVLAAIGLSAWIPTWLCAGVGIHFLPASRLFETPFLGLIGLTITAASASAVAAGLTTTVPPSVVAGAGAGACLLVAALGSLAGGVRAEARRATP
jgi:hypothetical protein